MSPRDAALRRGLPPAAAGISAPSDRRFRRPDLRPTRRKRLGQIAWNAAKWVGLGTGALAVVFWLGTTVLGSEMLRVKQLVVRGTVRLSVGDVEALVDGIRGERIFTIDFEQYRRRLMDSPWVESVTLWRVLPSTVEVRVVERSPLVIARVGQQLYLVDAHGVIIDEYGPQYREFDLPIVDGLISTAQEGGPLVEPERLRLVDRLLAAFGAQTALRERLSQVDVSNPRDAVVLIDDDPAFVHLGDAHFVERLQSYLELAPTLRDRLAGIDSIDLRFDERIYVRSKTTHETRAVKK
jgi:cell division septal protein FtsQ